MKLLHVYTVTWLSVEQVMMRFADILLALLTLFKYVYIFSISCLNYYDISHQT